MTDMPSRLITAFASRYAIEDELGAGGMGPRISLKKADVRG